MELKNKLISEYVPFYQPIIDLETFQTIKYESLARFKHNVCLDIEEIFKSIDITDVVLYLSLDFALTHKVGYKISINLSIHSMTNKLFKKLSKINTNKRKKIEFEILERDLITTKESINKIKQIQSMGFSVSLDDFGQGGANVEILEYIKFDFIKIDLSVLLSKKPTQEEIKKFKHIIGFLHCYSINIVAERIETEEHLKVCLEFGIRYGQGYLLGTPMLEYFTQTNFEDEKYVEEA